MVEQEIINHKSLSCSAVNSSKILTSHKVVKSMSNEKQREDSKEICQICGISDKHLTEHVIRKNFAFGKNFPAEYEQMLLCHNCIDNYEQKNKKMKVLAYVALLIILTFMGINFAILFSPTIF